nr:TIGR02679 family protein [Kribbella italica]
MSSGHPVRRISLGPLAEPEREALADLLGLDRLPAARTTVKLADLEQAVGGDLRRVVTAAVGPIGNLSEARRTADERRARLWDWFTTHPVIVAQPALLPWAQSVRRSGLIGGTVETTRSQLEKRLLVLGALPAAGSPLPVFAESVLGDPHALDDGTAHSTSVLKALASMFDRPVPGDAAARRELWRLAGVSDDELSSTVLIAGFHPTGAAPSDVVLRICAEAGEATVLTLRQLRRSPLRSGSPPAVWVFENPSIAALALRRFGPSCPPLVCLSGWPSGAGILLLQQLREARTKIYYHGDFDGEGLRITASMIARVGAVPWHLRSVDYLAAVGPQGPPVGRVSPAPWDESLAGSLLRHGIAVPEERVATALLDAMAAEYAGPSSSPTGLA